MTKIIEVIETYEKRGRGIDEDPVRRVYQLWTKEGVLIFEDDSCEKFCSRCGVTRGTK